MSLETIFRDSRLQRDSSLPGSGSWAADPLLAGVDGGCCLRGIGDETECKKVFKRPWKRKRERERDHEPTH